MRRLIFALALIPFGAQAHQAIPTAAQPYGWAYPGSCCSGYDCADTRSFPVKETAKGYEFTIQPGEHPRVNGKPYSDFIPYGDDRIKESPDLLFHACISPHEGRQPSRTICLFVPPRGV